MHSRAAWGDDTASGGVHSQALVGPPQGADICITRSPHRGCPPCRCPRQRMLASLGDPASGSQLQ
eukprot:1189965-Alexandrium_andersonii.AAC.1